MTNGARAIRREHPRGCVLHVRNRVGDGAFADVFADGHSTVAKLFRRQRAVTTRQPDDPLDNEVVTRAMWDAECQAYELLASAPHLAAYAAPYYGRMTVVDVVGNDGQSVADHYILDCAYRLQRLDGRAHKMSELLEHPLFSEIDPVLDAMRDAGVGEPYDGSVFIPGHGCAFTIIDIAASNIVADLTDAIEEHGRVSDHARRRWGRPITAKEAAT